ncbi:MAG TPA: NADH-quinone oxidoreductase subunit C [Candidatus Methanoculleus thermohydrogenotrophicum]|nr:NADH-quinone oxidoreductase subunit C [Candidatus Methanoculleus thermohydrogenotrophicum]HOB18362.1 NADH-quinone oxidoreductase subunit C [Candidatus Methanoculleus thermohydrogenotrophicum]HPZ38461.1 NADH-quinone oxidoreductase subunit C [Candidatus Methanoculleus thermohydrogenotrophicum]HQC91408.1 NADH-quinone oxidoreductase subunit C [Candidatus Methanoculleus thermohydrogenotrophicum]
MVKEEQTTTSVALEDLIREVEGLHADGYRLVQIGCTDIGGAYEINYSFDKDYQFRNLRLTVGPEEEVPSISGIYWGAFVYENELHDLFGIPVTGINIDFKGTFIKTAEKYPFSVTRRGGD